MNNTDLLVELEPNEDFDGETRIGKWDLTVELIQGGGKSVKQEKLGCMNFNITLRYDV